MTPENSAITSGTGADQPDESLATAGVVHDVNQMLAVITGRAGLLLNRVEDPELAPHLQAILLAANDAVNMLRRLSVSTAGTKVGANSTQLRDVAEQARLLVWPVQGARWSWDNRIADSLMTTVPQQIMREVLCNVLLNALEVMPDGGQILLSAESTLQQRVCLRVVDSGPGLPAGDPEQFFVRGVSASGEAGRGIGLAGCRQLLAGAGGQLRADQTTDAQLGATFVLDVPATVETSDVSPIVTGKVPAMDVLVVDDEVVMRDMLAAVLDQWGCRAQCYRDGAGALAHYVPGSAAVAVIDMNLPGLGGLELATALRDCDPHLSIVLVTGWLKDDILAEIDSQIVDQTAYKPLELPVLGNILRSGYKLNQERRSAASQD